MVHNVTWLVSFFSESTQVILKGKALHYMKSSSNPRVNGDTDVYGCSFTR